MAEITEEQEKMELAVRVYEMLCTALDNRKWEYTRDKGRLLVKFGVNGKDIPISFIVIVDASRQLVRIASPLPFKMSEEKRMEGAIATCVATYSLADGSFDYDMRDGEIAFRITASFMGSLIGEELLQYLISVTCGTVDEYNDKFKAINDGTLSLEDFIKQE